jgi:hypothetical protein
MIFKPLLILLIPLLFTACDKRTDTLPTHNKAVFAQGRYCTDYLKFECLPESRDPTILKGNEPLADGKFNFYDWDEKRFKNLERINNMEDKERKEKMEHYVLTPEDYKWMANVSLKQWYKEMETTMEDHYPEFWGDTPRSVRHRWMRLCIAKGNKYGYGIISERVNDKGEVYDDSKRGTFNKNYESYELADFPIERPILDKDGKIQVGEGVDPSMQQWIELCGRIGLNFDRDPKWKYILDFVKLNTVEASAGEAVTYIDFTIYGKDYDEQGNQYTDWYLQDALRYLPYPNRPVPKLNDPDEESEPAGSN